MYIVQADNVAEAYRAGMALVHEEGVEEDSRNGPVCVLPRPLMTHYTHPKRHVLLDEKRDANPFFHLYESMWMLTGWNSIRVLKHFNSNIITFSDDGNTLNGAYGERWRVHFGYDQINQILGILAKDPNTRRAVLGMWDPRQDLNDQGSKDLPCNTHIYFRHRGDFLDMTVCCRSNDLVWGCYGANAVHMSLLLEYVAGKLGMLVGSYYQLSNNAHVYSRHYSLLHQGQFEKLYDFETFPMSSGLKWWDVDCTEFVMEPYQVPSRYHCDWFRKVMAPLGLAHQAYKDKRITSAIDFAKQIEADDWRAACVAWLERRA